MATTGTGVTNTQSNSCVEVRLDCAEMWSLAQQFAYARLRLDDHAMWALNADGTYLTFDFRRDTNA